MPLLLKNIGLNRYASTQSLFIDTIGNFYLAGGDLQLKI